MVDNTKIPLTEKDEVVLKGFANRVANEKDLESIELHLRTIAKYFYFKGAADTYKITTKELHNISNKITKK